MKVKNIILWLSIAIVSIGCGGPSAILIKPDATKNIRSIAILEIKNPIYQMMDLGSATPWGAISEQNRATEIYPKFIGILKKEKFSFNKYLTNQLHISLRKAGYKTFAIKVKRKNVGKFLENYKKYNSSKVDALLDIAPLTAGYVVENGMTSSHWRPETKTFVRLVNARNGEIIYQDTMMYGYHNPFMSGVDLDAPKKFHFNEREDIFKAGNKTIVAGLKDAAKQVAVEVAKKLKK
jgi:hypothetical protein